jgi:bacillolysin
MKQENRIFTRFAAHGLASVFLLLLLLGFNADMKQVFAQTPARVSEELARICDPMSTPGFLIFKTDINVPASDLFRTYKKVFGLEQNDEMVVKRVTADSLGFTHYRYQQTYKNLMVEGAEYIVHERNGVAERANGILVTGLDMDVVPAIPESTALESALHYIGAKKYMWEDLKNELWLKKEQEDENATFYPKGELLIASPTGEMVGNSFRLAYRFDIYSQQPLSRYYVYVDAKTGVAFRKRTRIYHDDAVGTAYTLYNGTQTIITDWTGSTYRLRESGRGNGIMTYNMEHGTSYGNAVDFTDDDGTIDNIWTTDHAAYNAHWGAEATYDYYLTKHDRNSYDGSGARMKGYVHYYNDNDPKWNCNAWWDGSRVTYADCDLSSYSAFTAIDVVGHEFTHAVTDHEANLNYANESGALNESFSDIFGTAIEFYKEGANGDWFIGEDVCRPSHSYFRDMSNPNDMGDPDTYLGTYWHPYDSDPNEDNDWGGVHTNCGVQNYWFYLLSNGGSGINDNGDHYSVSGIGIDVASAIAFRSLTTYLHSTSGYNWAAWGADLASIDLFGSCSQERLENARAWYAVGLPEPQIWENWDYYDAISVHKMEGVWLQNNCTIHTGANLTIGSLQEIRLNPGFHAEAGSEFTAYVGCRR